MSTAVPRPVRGPSGKLVTRLVLIGLLFAIATFVLEVVPEAAANYWYLLGPPLTISAYLFGLRGALLGSMVTIGCLVFAYSDSVAQYDQALTFLSFAFEDAGNTSQLQRLSGFVAETDPRRLVGRTYGGLVAFILTNVFFGLMVDRSRKHEALHVARTADQFRRYFSPQLVDRIVKGEQGTNLESVRKELTIIFADLRGFTALTERVEPEELAHVLNDYLSAMTEVVFKYDGTLDKYIGDAVMAFFGDPISHGNDAERAVRAAVEMRERFLELRLSWSKIGEESLHVGIGLNTGYVTVGNIGSPVRVDYTVVGSAVNVASRLADAARPGQILTTQRTLATVRHLIDAESLGALSLQGVPTPVEVLSVKGLRLLPLQAPEGKASLEESILELAAGDSAFRAFLLTQPDQALRPYRLTPEQAKNVLNLTRLLGYAAFRGITGSEASAFFRLAVRCAIPAASRIDLRDFFRSPACFCVVVGGELAEFELDEEHREHHCETLGRGQVFVVGQEEHLRSKFLYRAVLATEIAVITMEQVAELERVAPSLHREFLKRRDGARADHAQAATNGSSSSGSTPNGAQPVRP